VQKSRSLLDQHEIVLYEALLDKRALIGGNHLVQVTGQSVGKDFSH
jgi:hypothetical protein